MEFIIKNESGGKIKMGVLATLLILDNLVNWENKEKKAEEISRWYVIEE